MVPKALKSEAPCPLWPRDPHQAGPLRVCQAMRSKPLLSIVCFHPWDGRLSLLLFIFPWTFVFHENINIILINFFFFFRNKWRGAFVPILPEPAQHNTKEAEISQLDTIQWLPF